MTTVSEVEDGASVAAGVAELEPNEFRVADVPPGTAVLLGDVAVFNVGGRVCASQAQCTHMGGPLHEGKLEGSTVTCPFHSAQFNVCTGAVLRGPATESLALYQITIENGIGRIELGFEE
jgi:nitrite reductase/ring-hydroxylating ferredoxin subunit